MAGTTVRRAEEGDLARLEDARAALARETAAAGRGAVARPGVGALVAAGGGVVAERDGSLVGYALAEAVPAGALRLTDLYVVPSVRREGIAAALVRALVERAAGDGVEALDLEVASSNAAARAVFQHWGLHEERIVLAAPLERLRDRLQPTRHSVSFASIHVQTDDAGWVERTAAQFAPRIGSPGSRVAGPRNGWTAIYDPVIDGDPTALLRYAREVSERMGAVVIALSLEVDEVVRLVALDRGGIVDEYLSVPEFYGPLPPGDVIGLAANATVLHRLTGADPAAVKAVARTGASPDDLPPARELLAAIAGVLGLEGALHGFADAS